MSLSSSSSSLKMKEDEDGYKSMIRSCTMELIGTFILTFTIQASVSLGATLAPLAIGGILIGIVYAGGPISGAHYNPVVSFAVALRGGGEYVTYYSDMLFYWIAQFIGGVLGGFFGAVVTQKTATVKLGHGFHSDQALLAEIAFTFIFCFVVLASTTSTKAENNHYYGLAIGLVVMSGTITVGPISGGAFNPAVAIGLNFEKVFFNPLIGDRRILSKNGLSFLYYAVFVVLCNFIGAALAWLAYSAVEVAPKAEEKRPPRVSFRGDTKKVPSLFI